jgi:phosphoserine phosphatase
MAIAYDFDGTLAPGNMQEHNFIPALGVKPKAFWGEVVAHARQHQADPILAYMSLMLLRARAKGIPVRRESFQVHGNGLPLFEGVETWFDRISAYGRKRGVKVEHYIVSSGNEEIVAGTSIAKKFEAVYASKFLYDDKGDAVWPALAINYTTKTQYLFRINKGVHDITDNARVNEFVEKASRAVPFENMVFVGDGETDVPSFRLVKDQGGLSIAVFQPNAKGARTKAARYLRDGRVHCVVPANYAAASPIEGIVTAQIDLLAARAALAEKLAEVRPRGETAA